MAEDALTYEIDLKDNGSVWLNIDCEQNTLGLESFIFNYLDEYVLKGRSFSYRFTMMPIVNKLIYEE